MKEKNKLLAILAVTFSLVFLSHFDLGLNSSEINYDCENLDVVFLKPQEKTISSEFTSKGFVVVIPEEETFIANSKLLEECPDFEISEYINTGDIFE